MAYVVELAELHGDRLVLHVDAEGSPLDVAELVALGRCEQTELYMCGPIRLMDAVRRGWQDAGLPPANLRYETFGSSGWFEPEEFVVRIPQRQVETTVRTDETLLEALTRAGVDLMYDCRKGECGLCLLDVCVRGGHPRPPRRLPQRRPAGAGHDDLDVRVQGRRHAGRPNPDRHPEPAVMTGRRPALTGAVMTLLQWPPIAATAARALQLAVRVAGRRAVAAAHERFPEMPRRAAELTIPTSVAPARVVVYRPETAGSSPVHVNFHGGGFVLPLTEGDDPLCRFLAASGVTVVNVDYVLAPQHRFPGRRTRRTRWSDGLPRTVRSTAGTAPGSPWAVRALAVPSPRPCAARPSTGAAPRSPSRSFTTHPWTW